MTRKGGVSAGERDGFKGRGSTPNDTKIGLVRAGRDSYKP